MATRVRESIPTLFDVWCEVSPGVGGNKPLVLRKYPEDYDKDDDLKNIPNFTFPCKLDNTFVLHYSFVLTCVDSKYRFGFCRFDPKSNTALVIMSFLPWHDIFYKFLDCCATLVNSPNQGDLESFLNTCKIPPMSPGETLKVSYNAGRNVFVCVIPENKLLSIPENFNLTEFFSALDAKCMIGLWAALLNERRIAIIASKPSRLSACVQAANAMLFPMTWQHVYIPILPKVLVDYLLAPMPFLIGVPRSVFEKVKLSDLGEMVVIDADTNKITSSFNDSESLPTNVVADLKKALGDKHALGDAVSRAFLRALVTLIGGYRQAMCVDSETKIQFNPNVFLKTRKPTMKPFLKKILESQIFYQFVEDRVNRLNTGVGFMDEFEVECSLYEEGIGTSSSQSFTQQYKDWAKNVKRGSGNFLKNVKDKANPAVQTAVKTVRQGGKNVRAKVKGLKIKLPKAGSSRSSITTTDESRGSHDSSDSSQVYGSPTMDLSVNYFELEDFLHNAHSSTKNEEQDLYRSEPMPRIPERPQTSIRYPIVSTTYLIKTNDTPEPPPRSGPPALPHFTTTIIENSFDLPDFQTSALVFSTRNDRNELNLKLSNQRRSNCNGIVSQRNTIQDRNHQTATDILRKSTDSDVDLIKLDGSPDLEEFDPLKLSKNEDHEKTNHTSDSALLHEYGLDFSQFRLDSFTSSTSYDRNVKFN